MTADEHQRVIDELQAVIDDTQHTLDRFEATDMASEMPEDVEQLHAILDRAVRDQKAHTLRMLTKNKGHPLT
ncbi:MULTISPECIES: hypothetical protein [unclassified Halomonas]|uniref:hypothetical protein n=1 Tax=unclassified Halomonas TaxID=2609666 RepID=UPI002887E60E|nr:MULTISPECIES: hypothetical protein [unclassified Halomonas]MDT0500489.1 hypothetical protein [Halomonas sp. PAR7]MDT0511615.1 hypothetical protein [Halomonas sp. LES1]MDT0590097.1 hypothetical protein [Halomonas sp. PAR8]